MRTRRACPAQHAKLCQAMPHTCKPPNSHAIVCGALEWGGRRGGRSAHPWEVQVMEQVTRLSTRATASTCRSSQMAPWPGPGSMDGMQEAPGHHGTAVQAARHGQAHQTGSDLSELTGWLAGLTDMAGTSGPVWGCENSYAGLASWCLDGPWLVHAMGQLNQVKKCQPGSASALAPAKSQVWLPAGLSACLPGYHSLKWLKPHDLWPQPRAYGSNGLAWALGNPRSSAS